MRKALTEDFWGLHKNMHWAFPLISQERKEFLT